MKTLTWLTTGTTIVFVMVAGTLHAQTTPPTEPTAKPDEATTGDAPAKAERWNELTVSYWESPDNINFKRDGRLPEGLAIQSISLLRPFDPKSPFVKFNYRGQPYRDNTLAALVIGNQGHTSLQVRRIEGGNYVFDWANRGPSEFKDAEYLLDHSFSRDFGGFLGYREFANTDRFPAPREDDRTRNEMLSAGVGGKVLSGNLNLSATSRRTVDELGFQPVTMQRNYGATYSHDLGDRINLEGQFGYTRIQQQGLEESTVRSYSVAGNLDLGPVTGIHFQAGRQDFDLPNVQNTYVRKRLFSSARLIHRIGGWSLQTAYRRREVERVRTDQSFVDVPKFNEYDARLSGRLGPARLTVRGTWEDMKQTAVFNTSDPRNLFWDDRGTFQVKLDGGNDTVALYGSLMRRFQTNSVRNVDVNFDQYVVGGSYVVSPGLNGYAEIAYEDFRAKGDAGNGTSLDVFFPNARTAAFGLAWAKDPTLNITAGLNLYESGDLKGSQLTFNLRKAFSPDHEFGLVVAPWRQTDRLYGISGYRETIVSAQYTVKF